MIRIKPGVTVRGVRPEMVLAITIAGFVFADYAIDLVLTSVTDGAHSLASLHYAGAAADCRTYHIPNETMVDAILTTLAECLGEDYDVVRERDHFHIEFQPKRPE